MYMIHAPTHKQTRAHTYTHPHTNKRARTHTHTHTHTHAHTHTHVDDSSYGWGPEEAAEWTRQVHIFFWKFFCFLDSKTVFFGGSRGMDAAGTYSETK